MAGEVIEIWRCDFVHVCVRVPVSNRCDCYWFHFWEENKKRLKEEKRKKRNQTLSTAPLIPLQPLIRSWRRAVKWACLNAGFLLRALQASQCWLYQLYWIDAGGHAGQRLSEPRLRWRWREGVRDKKLGEIVEELCRKKKKTSADVAGGLQLFFFCFLPQHPLFCLCAEG